MQDMRRLYASGALAALLALAALPSLSQSSSAATIPHPAAQASVNPWTSPPLAAFLRSRSGDVTAGLYDPATGATYLYRPDHPEVTASMVKVDILADLLYESQQGHRALSPTEQSLATSMIEDSDNTAAQQLWNDIGGFGTSTRVTGTGGYYAIQDFNRLLGFNQTITNWGWGLMQTTPADYLRLLQALDSANSPLSSSSRSYENTLMRSVTPSQRFGLPTGVPSSAQVEVKNGWYPEPTGWQINSCAHVQLGAINYLAVIMTARNPNEDYGMATVDDVGRLLWAFESAHK